MQHDDHAPGIAHNTPQEAHHVEPLVGLAVRERGGHDDAERAEGRDDEDTMGANAQAAKPASSPATMTAMPSHHVASRS